MKKIDKKERWKGKSTILLILPISAVDTTPFFETERRIRENFGLHLKKDVANKLNLPVPTEWVLTTQGFIDKVKDRVTEMKKAKKPISTAFFKQEGYKFEQYLRKEHDVALGQLKEKGFLPQKVDIGRKERKEKEGKKEVIVVTEIKDAFSTLTPDLREVLPSPAGDAKTPDMDETAEKPKSVGTSGSGRTKASGKSGARTVSETHR
nr:hypothetical protein BaRGS_023253 [Batillaria attramentaria]